MCREKAPSRRGGRQRGEPTRGPETRGAAQCGPRSPRPGTCLGAERGFTSLSRMGRWNRGAFLHAAVISCHLRTSPARGWMSAGPTPYAEELAKQGLQHQEILEAVAIAAFGFQQPPTESFRSRPRPLWPQGPALLRNLTPDDPRRR